MPRYQSIWAQVSAWISYDPLTGVFTRTRRRGRWPPGPVRGGVDSRGQRQMSVNRGGSVLLHRLAWTIMTGEEPPSMIIHRDGDKTNNRWDNLRDGSAGYWPARRGSRRPPGP